MRIDNDPRRQRNVKIPYSFGALKNRSLYLPHHVQSHPPNLLYLLLQAVRHEWWLALLYHTDNDN